MTRGEVVAETSGCHIRAQKGTANPLGSPSILTSFRLGFVTQIDFVRLRLRTRHGLGAKSIDRAIPIQSPANGRLATRYWRGYHRGARRPQPGCALASIRGPRLGLECGAPCENYVPITYHCTPTSHFRSVPLSSKSARLGGSRSAAACVSGPGRKPLFTASFNQLDVEPMLADHLGCKLVDDGLPFEHGVDVRRSPSTVVRRRHGRPTDQEHLAFGTRP
jgi:hypothetical protein